MGSPAPNREAAEKIGVPLDRLDKIGVVISEDEELMREILLVPVETPEGTMHVLREEFADKQSTEDYFVPNARWEVALLLRARGTRISAIARLMDLSYIEVLHWFHTPGIVEDLYSLMRQEERERLEIRSQERVFNALADEKTSVADALAAVKTHVELFNPQQPSAHDSASAEAVLNTLMKTPMPLPKG